MLRLRIHILSLIILTLGLIVACSKSDHEVMYASETEERQILLGDSLEKDELSRFLYGTLLMDSTDKGLIHSDWLYALEGIGSEKLLWMNRESYGFIDAPSSNKEMAIGYGFAGDYLTFNCAGCHAGYLKEGKELLIIPGGSNSIGPRGYVMIHLSLIETLKKRKKFDRFYQRLSTEPDFYLSKRELKDSVQNWTENYLHSYLESVLGLKFPSNGDFLTAYRIALRWNKLRRQSFSVGSHPFTTATNLWSRKGNFVRRRARVDFPPIFNYEHYSKYHYSGNASSRVERSIIASLNSFNQPSLDNIIDLDLEKILAMETASFALEAPAWPESLFGAIDSEKAQRGELIFEEHCISCHLDINDHPESPVYYDLDAIGTDDAYFDIWKKELKLKNKDSKRILYDDFLNDAMVGFMANWQQEHQYSDSLMNSLDPSSDWSFSRSWLARPLNGIWASPPYLHNGSVPTLYDLLLPPKDRPKRFSLGVIEYDQLKVGVQSDAPTSISSGTFKYNTGRYGSGNEGHEYGTELIESDRWALVEYLKTL